MYIYNVQPRIWVARGEQNNGEKVREGTKRIRDNPPQMPPTPKQSILGPLLSILIYTYLYACFMFISYGGANVFGSTDLGNVSAKK